MTRPLDGVVVVALEQAVAAPLCTRHLGDLGARVIKIEDVHTGDFARTYDDVVHGMSAHFVWLNRNKESVSIDIKRAGGRAALEALLARADVVVQNLGPGAASRLGVAAADVVGRYPSVVAVDISGYGVGGPFDDRRAYDLLAQAEGGSCAITGWPDHPAKPGIPLADIGAAMHAVTAILAALYQRRASGCGASLSISMLDVVADWMGFALNQVRYGGHAPEPNGVSSPMVAPYGSYPTKDGHRVVLGTTNDREFTRVAEMIGNPAVADDPDLASNALRVKSRDRVDALIAEWTAVRSLDEIQAAADAYKIGHARLNQVHDVLAHPQLGLRNRWVEIESPVGSVTGLLPPTVSDTWTARMDRIPALGEDSRKVLQWLGYGHDAISELVHDGAVRE